MYFEAFSTVQKKKIQVDQVSEFYNNSFVKWLKDTGIEMYSTCNEAKSVVAERFIRTLKQNIYKHMTTVSKNVYFDVLDDIIKKKPTDVKSNYYAEYNIDSIDKEPIFKIVDHVRISRYKTIFTKRYAPDWQEEVKNTVPWPYVITYLNFDEIVGTFYEKELQTTNQEEFRIKKVIKRRRNKLYVK